MSGSSARLVAQAKLSQASATLKLDLPRSLIQSGDDFQLVSLNKWDLRALRLIAMR